jgi:hypothetical protein
MEDEMKRMWSRTLVMVVGAVLLAGAPAMAQRNKPQPKSPPATSCEKECENDTKVCTAMCKKHAANAGDVCLKACRESELECKNECVSSRKAD